MFSLETGAACSLPAIKSVATIGVRVIDGHVEVTLP
jgi:nitrite reductase/ring-hydroxylating ferredoxin subunit